MGGAETESRLRSARAGCGWHVVCPPSKPTARTSPFRHWKAVGVCNTCVAEGIMTSPELNDAGRAGYGAETGRADHSSTAAHDSGANRVDDVSFARTMGVDQASEKAKDLAQRGLAEAEDVMGQLQAKASELTSNLIDKVNVDELTQKLERQVREHPARTLLMAAGAGFLLGRAARK